MLKVGEGSTHIKELAVSLGREERERENQRRAPSLFFHHLISYILHTSTHTPTIHSQPLNPEDYIAVGLAMCYKINDGGKLDGM